MSGVVMGLLGLLGLLFIITGAPKIIGVEYFTKAFDDFGYPQVIHNGCEDLPVGWSSRVGHS